MRQDILIARKKVPSNLINLKISKLVFLFPLEALLKKVNKDPFETSLCLRFCPSPTKTNLKVGSSRKGEKGGFLRVLSSIHENNSHEALLNAQANILLL